MGGLIDFINAISPLEMKTWDAVLPLFKLESLEPYDFFVKENENARQIAFLEEGCVRAFFTNEKGKEYNKQFFVAPSFIGAYTSLLTQENNKIPQQALTKCVIWAANYKEIEKLYKKYHDLERLGRKIAEILFLEKERKELEMALQDATHRYLNFQNQFPSLEQHIPQFHIASYLGISTTQLSRIRSKLRKS